MPRIINTFASENPLAKAIGSLGNSMFGDQLTPALKRQQLADLQREQSGVEELARTFGAADGGAVNFNRAAESAVLGGLKPEDVAMFTNYLAGNITGPRSDLTTNAMAGAGKYGDSAQNLDLNRTNAFNMNAADNAQSGVNNAADIANSMAQFKLKPIEATLDGQPGFVEQGQATTTPGAAPILNESQVPPIDQFRRQLQASEIMFPGDPAAARAHAIEQLSKQKTGVTVNNNMGDNGADAELRTALSKEEGKRWSDIQAAGVTSSNVNQQVEVLDELAQSAPVGPITGRLAQMFPGFSTAGDAFSSISTSLAPSLRTPGSGSTSDIEYEGFLRALPRLQNTPGGNSIISQVVRAKHQMNIQRAAIVTDYQNGDVSAKKARQMLQEINTQSIVTPEMKALIGVDPAGAQTVAPPATSGYTILKVE